MKKIDTTQIRETDDKRFFTIEDKEVIDRKFVEVKSNAIPTFTHAYINKEFKHVIIPPSEFIMPLSGVFTARFTATAEFTFGDYFWFDKKAYTCYDNVLKDLETKAFVSGSTMLVEINIDNNQIIFNLSRKFIGVSDEDVSALEQEISDRKQGDTHTLQLAKKHAQEYSDIWRGNVVLKHAYSNATHVLTGEFPITDVVTILFVATSPFKEGDVFSINNTLYTPSPLGEKFTLPNDIFISGDVVSVEVDTLSRQMSFKMSGGASSNGAVTPNLFLCDRITGKTYIVQVNQRKIELMQVTSNATSLLLLKDIITDTTYNVVVENMIIKIIEAKGKGSKSFDNLYDINTGILYSLICENKILKIKEV